MRDILLVEDEKIIQIVHKKVLEKLGGQVDIASSGEEALEKMSHAYQLIFMDIGLPGMSGIEAIKKIRASKTVNKDLPIVVITAYASEDVRDECLAAGANTVYTKPMMPENFKKILQDFS